MFKTIASKIWLKALKSLVEGDFSVIRLHKTSLLKS